MNTPILDVVLPVYNEADDVAASVRRVHAYLTEVFTRPFRITIADNASTDSTLQIAQALAAELPEVEVVHLDAKGRGRALKQVWLDSDAQVLAYMDIDLSTDLAALPPLIAPLIAGHSDLAIGSRLHRDSRVVRGVKREVISRGYNVLLKAALGARFSDAQCGFKAIRADAARELLPLVADPTWFFDTELLVLAERANLRIHEVPVDWIDDPDSRVDILSTAADDLRGVARMRRSVRRDAPTLDAIHTRLGRDRPELSTGGQLGVFATIGALSTVLHLGLFMLLSGPIENAYFANAIALVLATMANTAANRRWTFRVRGRARSGRHQLQGLAILVFTLAANSGGLDLLYAVTPHPSTFTETLVVAATTLMATAVKFLVMRMWMFAPRQREGQALEEAAPNSAANPNALRGS